jgi:hypothetical protein
MHVVACAAPVGMLEPAPLTSLPLASTLGNTELTAFWGADDAYYVLAGAESDGRWYRMESGETAVVENLAERVAIASLMADIIPLGGGRVAFPFGSSGRRAYRVWRSGANGGKTRILEVRAARSRRRPA